MDDQCPECDNDMILVDTTYSNYNSPRCYEGQHTGNIYACEECDELYIHDLIIDELYRWSY